MYDYALKHSRDQAHFGSICYLANACGIDMAELRKQLWAKQKQGRKDVGKTSEQKPDNKGFLQSCNPAPYSFFARGRAKNIGEGGENGPLTPTDNQADTDAEISSLPGSEPLSPLPLLYPGSYEWPWLIQEAISTYDDRIYRDVLLLGTLTLLGGAIGPMMHTRYSGRKHIPKKSLELVARCPLSASRLLRASSKA